MSNKPKTLKEALVEIERLKSTLNHAISIANSNSQTYRGLKVALEDLIERCEEEFATKEMYLWNLHDEENAWIEYRNAKKVLEGLKAPASNFN